MARIGERSANIELIDKLDIELADTMRFIAFFISIGLLLSGVGDLGLLYSGQRVIWISVYCGQPVVWTSPHAAGVALVKIILGIFLILVGIASLMREILFRTR